MQAHANNNGPSVSDGTVVRMDAITRTIVRNRDDAYDTRSNMTTKTSCGSVEHREYVAQQGSAPIAAALTAWTGRFHDAQQIFINTVVADVEEQ